MKRNYCLKKGQKLESMKKLRNYFLTYLTKFITISLNQTILAQLVCPLSKIPQEKLLKLFLFFKASEKGPIAKIKMVRVC